jgi:hypothetical protein
MQGNFIAGKLIFFTIFSPPLDLPHQAPPGRILSPFLLCMTQPTQNWWKLEDKAMLQS